MAIVQGSLALGLNYFDTAPMYGVGQSERRYGQALHGRARDSYVLSTKVGRVLHPSEPDSAQMTWSFDFSREGVRRSFETSLERLGIDYVDILYMHDPDNHYEHALTEALPVLVELRAQGRVKAIGAGMNQWEMELQFAKTGQCDCFCWPGAIRYWIRQPCQSSCRIAWRSTSAWSPVARTIAAYSPLVHGQEQRSTIVLPQLT